MILARVLVVLATLFAIVGLLAGYVRYQALDNETFSNSAEDLIENETIRDQIALQLVDSLYANVDVAAALEERLPRIRRGSLPRLPPSRDSLPTGRRSECSSARGRRSSGCARCRSPTSSCCACSTTT